jgi:alpha-tubulin suppressor-like RCC1 family protein
MGLDGLAYCWGLNANGLLGVGSAAATTNVPLPVINSAALGLGAVNTAGLATSCALNTAGQAVCWGVDFGRFGNGTTANFGSVTPAPAASGMTFASLHVSVSYICGLDAAGAAYCWGTRNDFGEMGIGSTVDPILIPTPAAVGLTFASLDEDDTNRSFKSTCGVTPAGAGWCWGANGFGQLGALSNESCQPVAPPFSSACSTSPVPVNGGIQFSQITVGGDHTCGLAVDGAVYCWGRNHVGQLGDGTLTDRIVPSPVRLN